MVTFKDTSFWNGLRITMFDRFTPIANLTEAKDVAQVFLDILQGHKSYLYNRIGMLRHDISMADVMYRRRDGQIFGVLGDFDSRSSVVLLAESSSFCRKGTLSYMAHELLGQSDVGRLYRHDIEALYYVRSTKGPVMKESDSNNKGRQQFSTSGWTERCHCIDLPPSNSVSCGTTKRCLHRRHFLPFFRGSIKFAVHLKQGYMQKKHI
ncbi:hypothetical protein DFS33DRAFT_184388 [Desarmillaria ectypa]|nr:hypothetical protein DFS33DRAFT_184388 [Desarmillaria ectypa]